MEQREWTFHELLQLSQEEIDRLQPFKLKPSPPYTDDERARMDALIAEWFAEPDDDKQSKLVRDMLEVDKERDFRLWKLENPQEPEENFSFPIGADLPMYRRSE